ncbi:MAG: hypothetical protein ACOC80_07535 [Petrotogales bacterium]
MKKKLQEIEDNPEVAIEQNGIGYDKDFISMGKYVIFIDNCFIDHCENDMYESHFYYKNPLLWQVPLDLC